MSMPRRSKDKEKLRVKAIHAGRKMLWQCDDGYWYAAVDKDNVPNYAVKSEPTEPATHPGETTCHETQ